MFAAGSARQPTRTRVSIAFLLAPAVLFLAVFYLGPFIWTVSTSLQIDRHAPSHLQLVGGNYVRLLSDAYYWGVLLQTFVYGSVVTLLTLLAGYPAAYFIARTRSRWKAFYLFMIISPLVISIIIRSYGWMVILGDRGVLNWALTYLGLISEPLRLTYNWFGVIVAVVHVSLPFMILSIASVLDGIDPALEEAAIVHGASPWEAFRKVTFPLSLDGIGAGCTLVLMLTVGSFVTVMLLGGTETMILPLLIYQQITVTFDNSLAAALGTLLLTISLVLLYVETRLFRVRGR